MNTCYQKQKTLRPRAQAIVEFAIVMPVLMMVLVGVFEAARMAYIYTAVTNASREAVRYGSAIGRDESGNAKYQYCDGIKDRARRSAYFVLLTTTITYDHGTLGSTFDTCNGSVDTDVIVNSGTNQDRVVVEVKATYRPLIKLIPITPRTITSKSARTILGVFTLDS